MLTRFPRFAAFVLPPLAILLGICAFVISSNSIARGVLLSGIPVGGLSDEQAVALVAENISEMPDAVTFTFGDRIFESSLDEIGAVCDVQASVARAYLVGKDGNLYQRCAEILTTLTHGQDISLVYKFNEDKLEIFLKDIAKKIDKSPVNARLTRDEDKTVKVIDHVPGLKLDTVKTAEAAKENVNNGIFDIEMAVEMKQPSVVVSDFKGIDGVLGAYTTSFRPWERSRTHNVKLAAKAIDGILIKPYQIFSFNEVVGERTRARGYQDAQMFIEGRIEEGLGGGVCQVTTTLYNAALLANLKIARRLPHSRPVDYAPVGRDATVAFPVVDFKFENNTDAPIYITSSVGQNTLNITITGKVVEGQKVQIVASNHQVIKAPVVSKIEDDIELGKTIVRSEGRPGHRITISRIVKQEDEIVSREVISNDNYRPETRVIATSNAVSEN